MVECNETEFDRQDYEEVRFRHQEGHFSVETAVRRRGTPGKRLAAFPSSPSRSTTIHPFSLCFYLSLVDEECETQDRSYLDYVKHALTIFWRLIFAFIPPEGMSVEVLRSELFKV